MTQPPQIDADDLEQRLREFHSFISGEGELDGLSFGEPKKMHGRQAMFWWRKESPIPDAADALTTLRAEKQALADALRNIMIEADREKGNWTHLKRVIAVNARQAIAVKDT